MKRLYFILLFPVLSFGQTKDVVFNVVFKGKDIGTLTVTEQVVGEMIVRDLRTNTDAKILMMSVHVESELNSSHKGGELLKSTAYRHANRGPDDIHSMVAKTADGKYTCELNGIKHVESKKIQYTVMDFYVREPIGLNEVFSTMYAAFLPLKTVGTGKYLLETPDKKNSWYSYTDGKLVKIESETPLGNVVSTRK